MSDRRSRYTNIAMGCAGGVLVVLSLAACGKYSASGSPGDDVSSAAPSPTRRQTADPRPATRSTTAAPEPTQEVIFLQAEPGPGVMRGGEGGLSARTEGRLTVENNCLRLKRGGGYSVMLYWPYDFAMKTDDGVSVLDGEGKVAARPGDWVVVGGAAVTGGEVYQDFLRRTGGRCEGPYWAVSELVQVTKGTP